MRTHTVLSFAFLLLACTSCVSSKEFKSLTADYEARQAELAKCRTDYTSLTTEKQSLESQNATLNKTIESQASQITLLKENNTQALGQLQNMSVISAQQAESIKKSMENIGA